MATTATGSNGRATKRLRLSFADAKRCVRPPIDCIYLPLTHSSFSSPYLTIVVGEETEYDAQTFYESSDILTQHSGFFANALRNGWKEKEERLVRLPECSPEVFQIFLNFIHAGKIYSTKDDDQVEVESDSRAHFGDREMPLLAKCWVQGEILCSSSFKDATADALVQKLRDEESYPLDVYIYFYQDTATPNSMRRLQVDIAVWQWEEEDLKEQTKKHIECSEFLGDLALRLFSLSAEERKGPAPFTKNDCTYHEHVKEGKPCYKTIFNYD